MNPRGRNHVTLAADFADCRSFRFTPDQDRATFVRPVLANSVITPYGPYALLKESQLKIRILLIGTTVAGLAAAIGHIDAHATPRPDEGGVSTGPDVIVGALPDIGKYGSTVLNGRTIMSYSLGTTSCNIGSQKLLWEQATSNHPVIPQNMYRVKNGRIEQIGMSWIKHGFCALQDTLCGACTPEGPGCMQALGVGCSDPYSSGNNGWQGGLGPRSQVNASTGAFPYPFWSPAYNATVGRRIQIDKDDFDPALNAGAQYFGEGQYVHPEDSAAGNGDNNASYRRFTVGTFTSGAYNIALTGSTVQQKPAIFAWQEVHPDVVIEKISVPGDGVFYLGYRVTDNLNGTWRYEYAIFNLSSDRCGRQFSVPTPEGVTITNIGFRDIDYHSNEVFDNTDWTSTHEGGDVRWLSPQLYDENPNTNALRWSTLYNFWFDANTPPQEGSAKLILFKPGTPSGVAVTAMQPSAPAFAIGDLNQDGFVNGVDLAIVLGAWGTPDIDLNGDGTTDGADLAIVLGNWTP